MCIVNRMLVEDIAPLADSQHDVMRRLGISWNCWIKIAGGMPIRLSVGLRLRTRIMESAGSMPGLREKYPSNATVDGVDHVALKASFLRMVSISSKARPSAVPPLRSVRRAMQLEEFHI
jgi:hypothetical protein